MEKYYRYQLKPVILNILSLLLAILLFGLTLFIKKEFILELNGILLLYFFPLFLLHELLHATGFKIGGAKIENITLGIKLEYGIFYCMCKQEINKQNILIALALPLIAIGIITYIIGCITNNFILIFLSIINISGAIGDLIMLVDIIKMPKDIKYLDQDDPTSFIIISKKELKQKIFGLKMIENGIYKKENMKAKDKRKIVISKPSYVVLIIFFTLCILLI